MKGRKCVEEERVMNPGLSRDRLDEASEKGFSVEKAEISVIILKPRKGAKISAKVTFWLLNEGRQMGQ